MYSVVLSGNTFDFYTYMLYTWNDFCILKSLCAPFLIEWCAAVVAQYYNLHASLFQNVTYVFFWDITSHFNKIHIFFEIYKCKVYNNAE